MPKIEFTPEAIANVRAMYTGIAQADAQDAIEAYPHDGTMAERERWAEQFKERQISRRDNVLGVLITMIGLGGSLAADGEGLIGRNEFITYGVNKSSHNDVNTWSVNS